MEGGPRLASGVFRLVDLAVQHVGVHSIGAWMLYDDQQGRRRMHCVPLAFTDGDVKSSVEVLLIEEQIQGTLGVGVKRSSSAGVGGSTTGTEQQIETLSRLATTLESSVTGDDVSEFKATDVFQDAIFAPGHLCRPALQQAVEHLHLLSDTSNLLRSTDDVLKLDIASLRSLLTQAVNTAAEEHQQGPLGIWVEVISAYTDALRSYLAPRALIKLSVHRDEEQGLLLVRSGGSVSVVRAAEPNEIVAAGSWPPIWDKMRSSDSAGVKSILHAAGVLVDQVCGGRQALMMIRGCLEHGADLRAHILPAVLCWLVTSSSGGSRGGGGGGGASLDHGDMAIVHSFPLKLCSLCSAPKKGFASAIEAVVTLLANNCVPPGGDGRSPLASFSPPIISASMAQAHQTAGAQCECLLRIAILAAYVTSQHQLGTWTVPEEDRQLIVGAVSERLDWMMTAAGVAYWSTAAPIAKKSTSEKKGVIRSSTSGGGGSDFKATASDTANMVISLKIGDENYGGNGNNGVARKRARLTPSPLSSSSANEYAYPAEHLLSTFKPCAHAVRDLPDLQGIAATFSNWLLCVPKVHDIDLRRTNTPTESIALKRTLEVAPVLIRTHSAAALTELIAMAENDYLDDPRIMFFSACSKALVLSACRNIESTKAISSARMIRKLERESVSLFFRVAATLHIDVSYREYFEEKLNGVYTALDDLLRSFTSKATGIKVILPSDASKTQVAAADELYYHESLMNIFEKLQCHHAASRFAMAAAQHVPDALAGDNMAEEIVKRTGRFWSSVFTFCLYSGEFEEAYSALLSIEVADDQVDCVHKLVNTMVERGEIAALCTLPFAHTSLVVRNGQPAWVSLLDEAVSALKRRAALLELDSRPQPHQVLFDFHVARGHYQAAAAAMVSYARRLAAEAREDRNAVDAAQKALAAAVGALGLVDPERAWLEDPGGDLNPISKISKQSSSFVGEEGVYSGEEDDVLWVPMILTMSDLKIEHAIAVAKSSVAAVLPGGDVGTKTASDVFHQLIALKLHQQAFALADAAFLGTQQQRMREKAVFSLATTCAELQLQTGIGSSGGTSYYTSSYQPGENDERMFTDDGAPENEVGGDGEMTTIGGKSTTMPSSSAASASWRRLRTHLETYEKQGSAAGAMNLRVLAVDAVLGNNARLHPPLWLLAPFVPPPSEGPLSAKIPHADIAGLLRAYLKHGRVEDAAVLAVKVLSRVADSVPSVSLPRPAAVCLPHALLEELAHRVASSASPVKGDLAEKLNKAQKAAARQTQVLESIYAA